MSTRAEFRISYFIIGLAVFIAVSGVLWGFHAKMMENYGVTVPAQYNKTFQEITDMSGIDNTTAELKSLAFKDDVNKSKSFFGRLEEKYDILGLYFELGYETVGLTPKSLKIFNTMSDSMIDSNSNILGSAGPYLRFLGVSIVVILLIFLLVAIAVKWWV